MFASGTGKDIANFEGNQQGHERAVTGRSGQLIHNPTDRGDQREGGRVRHGGNRSSGFSRQLAIETVEFIIYSHHLGRSLGKQFETLTNGKKS
jgi:hypothetical protein